MIRLAGLRVLYGSFAAVDRLDLDIRGGELFGLLGPNGAGKSTTIRVLIGQRRPTAGTVTVAGYDVVREWALIKPLFGYVPDRENHFEEFTGRRNLEFFAQLYGVPTRRAKDCLDMVELDEAAEFGTQDRFAAAVVAVAVAMAAAKVSGIVELVGVEVFFDERGAKSAELAAGDAVAPLLVDHLVAGVLAANRTVSRKCFHAHPHCGSRSKTYRSAFQAS